jgi:hypothetical protein
MLACAVGSPKPSREAEERAEPVQKARPADRRGEPDLEGIESFTFSPDGRFLASRIRAPAPGRRGAIVKRGAPPRKPRRAHGTTLIVRRLAGGERLGNVSQYAWQDAEGTTSWRWRSGRGKRETASTLIGIDLPARLDSPAIY